MPTITLSRAETRSVSIAAPPSAVLDVVADPRKLPRWAPGFARAVRPDGEHWLVDNGEAELRIAVRGQREHGTVDLLAAADERLGAFTRVLPNGDGSEYLFTLFFADGTPEEAIATQMTTVEGDIQTVRAMAEGGSDATAAATS